MILALTIGVLVAAAVYLLLQREGLRIILGFVLLSHAVNLLIFSSGGIARREEPLGEGLDPAVTADPLPQAFVLTAIVISFAITIYLLVLTITGFRGDVTGDGGEEEDVEKGSEPAMTSRPEAAAPKEAGP